MPLMPRTMRRLDRSAMGYKSSSKPRAADCKNRFRANTRRNIGRRLNRVVYDAMSSLVLENATSVDEIAFKEQCKSEQGFNLLLSQVLVTHCCLVATSVGVFVISRESIGDSPCAKLGAHQWRGSVELNPVGSQPNCESDRL